MRSRGRGSRRTAAGDTRRSLLDAARRLFAEHGFWAVTVRDITRAARANLAAVSYHFGDKLSLYREVLTESLEEVRTLDPTLHAPPGSSAADQLRHYVRGFLPRIANPKAPARLAQRLMSHELEAPTPLAPWIAEQLILPRLRYLSAAIAELMELEPTDPRVSRSVMSLQAQLFFHLPNRFRRAALPDWDRAIGTDLASAADHVVDFTLAGIAGIAKRGRAPGSHLSDPR